MNLKGMCAVASRRRDSVLMVTRNCGPDHEIIIGFTSELEFIDAHHDHDRCRQIIMIAAAATKPSILTSLTERLEIQ